MVPETNSTQFHGHLDTNTLGGAGFASQFSALDAPPSVQSGGDSGNQDGSNDADGTEHYYWDLSDYDGIELSIGKDGDDKEYTFIVRDEREREKRDDGRDQAGVSWEVVFHAPSADKTDDREEDKTRVIYFPWRDFKATYRGKEVDDPAPFKSGNIRRIGIMMRRYAHLLQIRPAQRCIDRIRDI